MTSKCGVSTTITGHLSFGRGELDEFGFWSNPCFDCARQYEKEHPWQGTCWPFKDGKPGPAYDDVLSATEAICRTLRLR